jgi:hypothetical protein
MHKRLSSSKIAIANSSEFFSARKATIVLKFPLIISVYRFAGEPSSFPVKQFHNKLNFTLAGSL